MPAPNLRLERQIRQLGVMQSLKARLAYDYPLEAEDLWRRALELSEGDVDRLPDAVWWAEYEFLAVSPSPAAEGAACDPPPPYRGRG